MTYTIISYLCYILLLVTIYFIGYANGILKMVPKNRSTKFDKSDNFDQRTNLETKEADTKNSKSKIELDLYDRLNSVTGTKTSLIKVVNEKEQIVRPSKVSIPNRRKIKK